MDAIEVQAVKRRAAEAEDLDAMPSPAEVFDAAVSEVRQAIRERDDLLKPLLRRWDDCPPDDRGQLGKRFLKELQRIDERYRRAMAQATDDAGAIAKKVVDLQGGASQLIAEVFEVDVDDLPEHIRKLLGRLFE